MAPAALLIWPFVSLAIFAALGPVRGLIWTAMLGFLFLPEAWQFDLPGLPPYGKTAAISLSLVLSTLVFQSQFPKSDRPQANRLAKGLLYACLAGLVLAPIPTVLTNGDTLVNGPTVRSAMSAWDAVSIWSGLIILFVPMVLAARYLWRPEHMWELLACIVILGVFYTLLVLFEIRMSPQLHNWIYGYFQHDWLQHVRDGGFRPIVFLSHGLTVGIFLLGVTVAAFSLAKGRSPQSALYLIAGGWSFVVLLLSKNLGATLLSIVFCSLVLFSPRKIQLLAFASAAAFVLTYPVLKHLSAAPTQLVVELTERISPERAQSFQFRVNNEVALLDRAFERPFFGWGGYGRARIIDDFGRDLSITDGRWIIQFGASGWFGYLAFFGLLSLPLFLLWWRARGIGVPHAVIGIAAISAATLLNLIPNAGLSPVTLMIFGCLWACVLYGSDAAAAAETKPSVPVRQTRYTRFEGAALPVERGEDTAINRDRRPTPYRRPH